MRSLFIVIVLFLNASAAALAETKDRRSPEEITQSVAGPMALARASRLDTAEAVFETQYQKTVANRGASSKEAADLLSAMGIELDASGSELNRPELNIAALAYLKRTVAVARKAWGPGHPETAVALHDLAAVELKVDKDRYRNEAVAMLREAYAIRRRSLGLDNEETVATEKAIQKALEPTAQPPSEYPTLDATLKKGGGKLRCAADCGELGEGPVAGLFALILFLGITIGIVAVVVIQLRRQFGRHAIKKRAALSRGDDPVANV